MSDTISRQAAIDAIQGRKRGSMIDKPFYKSVPTFRNYEDYRDAEQYTKGWNDAMYFIFPEAKKERERESIKKNFCIVKAESEDKK